MKKFQKFKYGFSLAEALAVLLIIAIIIAVTLPVITKKKNSLSQNAVHGKWACKYIDGVLKSTTASNIDEELPPDNKWHTGCKFPSVAKTVKYLWVEVYGGGGGGTGGYATPWNSKLDVYPLGESAPRDGLYSIQVSNSSNVGTSMKWLNEDYISINGIYYTSDENLKSNCLGNKFSDYVEGKNTSRYATCKTYTAADKCVFTGDSSAIKTTDCISNTSQAGKYCYQNISSRPPNKYLSEEYMISECRSDGKEGCGASENFITFVTKFQSCSNARSLPYAHGGNPGQGLSGKIYLKKGEYLSHTLINQGRTYNKGTLGGYEHTGAYDGDDYALYHKKATIQEGKMHLNDVLVAKMYGGKAGLFSLSEAGASRCCTNCGKLSAYVNSSKTNEVFCAKDGMNGTTIVTDAYKSLLGTAYITNSQISIYNQYFHYFLGCNGQNGSYTANLYPTSRNNQYNFQIGKGGTGSKGDGTNTILESATDGEETFFEWIKAEGGKAAADFCKVVSPEEVKTNTYNAGIGGLGGSVKFPGGTVPKRNYNLTIEEDSHPNGRWTVTDGQSGTSGIIVVSW